MRRLELNPVAAREVSAAARPVSSENLAHRLAVIWL
jgi:hypothetical protein